MPRGRKPKPSAEKKLRGNPGQRPLNDQEPQPPEGSPEQPPHLTDEARAEWDRVLPLLQQMRVVTVADRAALAAYCQAWSRWVEAEQEITKHGTIVKSPNGFPIQNPYLAVANKALQQMHKLLVEFGLTPSSRSRLKPSGDKPTEPSDDLLQ